MTICEYHLESLLICTKHLLPSYLVDVLMPHEKTPPFAYSSLFLLTPVLNVLILDLLCIYVCMCVSVYVYVYMYVCVPSNMTCIDKSDIYEDSSTHTHTHIYIYINVYTHRNICIYIYIFIYININI